MSFPTPNAPNNPTEVHIFVVNNNNGNDRDHDNDNNNDNEEGEPQRRISSFGGIVSQFMRHILSRRHEESEREEREQGQATGRLRVFREQVQSLDDHLSVLTARGEHSDSIARILMHQSRAALKEVTSAQAKVEPTVHRTRVVVGTDAQPFRLQDQGADPDQWTPEHVHAMVYTTIRSLYNCVKTFASVLNEFAALVEMDPEEAGYRERWTDMADTFRRVADIVGRAMYVVPIMQRVFEKLNNINHLAYSTEMGGEEGLPSEEFFEKLEEFLLGMMNKRDDLRPHDVFMNVILMQQPAPCMQCNARVLGGTPLTVIEAFRSVDMIVWNGDSEDECPILRTTFMPGEIVARTKQCHHVFSQEGFTRHVSATSNTNRLCPVCRTHLVPPCDPPTAV